MILVVVLAELLQGYTALLARVLEQMLRGAPFPRRTRFLMLHSIPYGFPSIPLLPLPLPYAATAAAAVIPH